MQDGDSNKGKDEAKRGTVEQAHLMHDTRKHVFTVSNSYPCTYTVKAKKQKQGHNAELQRNIIYDTGTLKQFYLKDWRHTHTFTQNPKEMEVATSLCVESFSRDRNSELLRRGLRARASCRKCWPLDSTDGVLGTRMGFSGATSPLAHGIPGLAHGSKREKEGRLAGATPRRPTNQPRPERDSSSIRQEAASASKPPRPSLL